MTPRGGKRFRVSPAGDLAVKHRHAAGIDVHAAVHFVSVAAEDVPADFVNPDVKLPAGVRKFGAYTSDLRSAGLFSYFGDGPNAPFSNPGLAGGTGVRITSSQNIVSETDVGSCPR